LNLFEAFSSQQHRFASLVRLKTAGFLDAKKSGEAWIERNGPKHCSYGWYPELSEEKP